MINKYTETFFHNRVTLDLSKRIKILTKLKSLIENNSSQICEALKTDLGKGKFESYIGEIDFSINEIKIALKNISKWSRRQRVSSSLIFFPVRSYIYKKPLGKVLIIGPWNYPFQLVISPLVGAIAAGNTVLIKPSELAPETSKIIFKLLSENFDRSAICVVEGSVEEASFLLEQNFDHIFYTGNSHVGRIVMEKAAKNLTPVTLELGGKSPALVFTDNLDMAAKRIVWGKFFNAGQTCVAPDYVLIEKENREEFVRYCAKWITKFYGSDIANNEDYGRIVNARHFKRLVDYLLDVEYLVGGRHIGEKLFIEPTIVSAKKDSRIMDEEIFGPILPIVEIENFEKACAFVESRPHPLACYGFLHSDQHEDFLTLKAGGMVINDTLIHLSNEKLPFGGVGESGMGRYHGKFSFDTFTHHKAVVKRMFILDSSLRYPPYKGKLKFVRKLLALF